MQFCSLASGSNGNSHYIGQDDFGLLIDAGLSGKYIKNAMEGIQVPLERVQGILVTHEHTDHIKGVNILSKKLGIPVYGTQETLQATEMKLKLELNRKVVIEKNVPFLLGPFEVIAKPIAHDAVDPVGYIVGTQKHRIAVVTDLGHVSDEMMDTLMTCDVVLMETNHDVEMLKMGSYPYYLKRRILSDHGHLSNDAAADTIVKLAKGGRAKQILLGHLSKENNFPELAYETIKQALHQENIHIGIDIQVSMTHRDQSGALYTLV